VLSAERRPRWLHVGEISFFQAEVGQTSSPRSSRLPFLPLLFYAVSWLSSSVLSSLRIVEFEPFRPCSHTNDTSQTICTVIHSFITTSHIKPHRKWKGIGSFKLRVLPKTLQLSCIRTNQSLSTRSSARSLIPDAFCHKTPRGRRADRFISHTQCFASLSIHPPVLLSAQEHSRTPLPLTCHLSPSPHSPIYLANPKGHHIITKLSSLRSVCES
jgi:hypothetical protein